MSMRGKHHNLQTLAAKSAAEGSKLKFWRAPSRRRATRPPKQRGEREASPPRRDGARSPTLKFGGLPQLVLLDRAAPALSLLVAKPAGNFRRVLVRNGHYAFAF